MSKKLRTLILLFLLITTAAFLTTGCGKKEKPKGYTISGVVTNSANNLGIKNVKLAVGEKVVTTDVHGKWSVSGLTGPVTVGVITDNLGWTFDRTSVEVSGAASDLDFTVTFDGIEETIKRVSLDGAATIVVPPGTYNLSGAINIVSRDIHLKSTDPDDPAVVAATIIKDHGIYIYRTPNRSIVEGLTISDEKSSGISVSDRGVATIRKNVIEGCGMHGISITSTIPDQIEIIDNIIRNNSVTETFGRGINVSVSSPTPLVIAGNTISGNKQGLYILYSPDPESASDKIEVTLNNNSITANQQQLSGGGICFHNCEVTMDGDRINNNTADDYGGGLCAYASTITMRNCTFEGNKAKYGGALALRNGSSAEIKNTLFSSNTASDSGPVAHYSSNSSLELDATVTYGGGNSSSDIYQGY